MEYFVTLSILLTVTNTDSILMPIALGFHPYFNLLKEKRGKFINPINNFEFNETTTYTNSKLPLKFYLPDVGTILLTYSKQFKNLSYWAEPEGNFICIEPWVGAEGTILRNSKRINLKSQTSAEFVLKIELLH